MTSGVTTIQKTQNKKPTKKGLTKLISLNSVRPFLSVSHILPDNHKIPDK